MKEWLDKLWEDHQDYKREDPETVTIRLRFCAPETVDLYLYFHSHAESAEFLGELLRRSAKSGTSVKVMIIHDWENHESVNNDSLYEEWYS